MRENYNTYIRRIHSLIDHRACLPAEWEYFTTAPGVNRKFTQDGAFRPFYGDTTVFPLPEGVKKSLETIQASLYAAAGGMLSQALPAHTFHITLHDLSASGEPAEIEDSIRAHQTQMPQKLLSAQNQGIQGNIHRRCGNLWHSLFSTVTVGK